MDLQFQETNQIAKSEKYETFCVSKLLNSLGLSTSWPDTRNVSQVLLLSRRKHESGQIKVNRFCLMKKITTPLILEENNICQNM